MNNNSRRLLTLVTLLSTVLPSLAMAQANPRIMLEKSQAYELDNKIRAFRVPVTNSLGQVRYYDVTVTLGVSTTGVLNPTATVVATASPNLTSRVLIPGTYRAADGTTCTVSNTTLVNGRVQSFISCRTPEARFFDVAVTTGPLTDGHPYLPELVAARINTRPDVTTQTWGLEINKYFDVINCNPYVSSSYVRPVSAVSNGNTLILSIFAPAGYTNAGSFLCGASFTKQ